MKKFIVRPWNEDDIPKIYLCQKAAYTSFNEEKLCEERHYRLQHGAFPEGQFLVETPQGEVVGYATSLILQFPEEDQWLSYGEVTGLGTFSTHNPSGDTLYGADIAVHPDYRQKGVAALLYKQRKKLLKRLNLKRMIASGRIPGYKDYIGKMAVEEYINKVVQGELCDPSLSVHLKAGYQVKGIHMGYLSDEESLNYSTILEMINPHFNANKRRIAAAPIRRAVRKMRVCAVQYRMYKLKSWEEFVHQVEFFVHTANEYNSHFLLFPELFTAQLFSLMDKTFDTKEAIHNLSNYTEQYQELFTKLAKESNLHIIAGSHPVKRNDLIYNVAHLFTPTGNIYTQDKLHITPGERNQWAITAGNEIKVFETPFARIAIPICYDIEFPELCRALVRAGAEVLFVPFATDELCSYYRVRYCAQARSVENVVYVVLSGNVGNLHQVKSFLVNYGISAILTPSDVAFPKKGIAAEADPNTETVVMSDLDITILENQRLVGSVNPLQDRRLDLYDVKMSVPIKRITTQ